MSLTCKPHGKPIKECIDCALAAAADPTPMFALGDPVTASYRGNPVITGTVSAVNRVVSFEYQVESVSGWWAEGNLTRREDGKAKNSKKI